MIRSLPTCSRMIDYFPQSKRTRYVRQRRYSGFLSRPAPRSSLLSFRAGPIRDTGIRRGAYSTIGMCRRGKLVFFWRGMRSSGPWRGVKVSAAAPWGRRPTGTTAPRRSPSTSSSNTVSHIASNPTYCRAYDCEVPKIRHRSVVESI